MNPVAYSSPAEPYIRVEFAPHLAEVVDRLVVEHAVLLGPRVGKGVQDDRYEQVQKNQVDKEVEGKEVRVACLLRPAADRLDYIK